MISMHSSVSIKNRIKCYSVCPNIISKGCRGVCGKVWGLKKNIENWSLSARKNKLKGVIPSPVDVEFKSMGFIS